MLIDLADFADFALQDNQKVAISQLWYNGSYTIAAKPIKTLESHYTMIQFLINIYIHYSQDCYFHDQSQNEQRVERSFVAIFYRD